MRICVLGLGHVGAVSAACLARVGHDVIGVDSESAKVEAARGRLRATGDVAEAVRLSDLVLVCVGTPSLPNGGIDLKHLRRVAEQIGRALAAHPGAPVIAMRSTMLPGTTREVVIPILEKSSGKKAGDEFGLCVNVELQHPPKTIIGELNRASGDLLAALYKKTPGPLIRTDLETAEMVSYADNCWRALKVGFANELGSLCKALDVDAHRVMAIFCEDQNLKPGFAFGGACLPKDLRAVLHRAKTLDVSLPILSSVLPSNELQIERGVQAVMEKGNRKVGILGFSFKAGSDELRESPMVKLAERLIGQGYDLRIYDPAVSTGGVASHLRPLMMGSIDEVLAHAQTLVIGNAAPEFAGVPKKIGDGQTIIDFVRVCDSRTILGVYEGLCW